MSTGKPAIRALPGEVYLDPYWVQAGTTARVLIYQPGPDEPEEALRKAREMVAAHELVWEQLWTVQRQRIGKGPDGYRWQIAVDVHNPAGKPDETEAML